MTTPNNQKPRPRQFWVNVDEQLGGPDLIFKSKPPIEYTGMTHVVEYSAITYLEDANIAYSEALTELQERVRELEQALIEFPQSVSNKSVSTNAYKLMHKYILKFIPDHKLPDWIFSKHEIDKLTQQKGAGDGKL